MADPFFSGSAPDGILGLYYGFDFTTILVDSDVGPYVFSLGGGSLPPGMTLDSGGSLSGVPTLAGTYSFDVGVVDGVGSAGGGLMIVNIVDGGGGGGTGGGGGGGIGPVIVTASLPDGSIGTPYSQGILVTSGVPLYTFSITAGTLPPGLALVGATGVISGTPTMAGSYTFVVTVVDALGGTASATYTINIPSSPAISNSSLPNGTVGVPYLAALVSQGGTPPYSYHVTAGSLPPGLVLASTGGITGTPTTAGTFTLTIEVMDSNLPQRTGFATYTITISPAAIVNPVTNIVGQELIASEDGAIYAVIPGQRHDEQYDGTQVGFLQRWNGVRGAQANLALMQLGGASISAKGNGALNVFVTDDAEQVTMLTTAARPLTLQPDKETKRDLMAKAVPHSERYGVGFDNGGVKDAWFEMHTAILWVRKFFSARKA